MSLKQLHREFIDHANRSMRFGALPVEPTEPEVPVIAVSRWKNQGNVLVKPFQFRRDGDRDRFLLQLLGYERKVGHHATIIIEEDRIIVRVSTHDVDRITELDKEYAKFADVLFRDVVYSPDQWKSDRTPPVS